MSEPKVMRTREDRDMALTGLLSRADDAEEEAIVLARRMGVRDPEAVKAFNDACALQRLVLCWRIAEEAGVFDEMILDHKQAVDVLRVVGQ